MPTFDDARAQDASTPELEHLWSGPPLPLSQAPSTFAALWRARDAQLHTLQIVGEDQRQRWSLDAASIARAANHLAAREPSRRALMRLPYTSDAPLAALALALLVAGQPFGLPTQPTLEQLSAWMARGLIQELVIDARPRQAQAHTQQVQALRALCARFDVSLIDVRELLSPQAEDRGGWGLDPALEQRDARDQAVWHTSSGSDGQPKRAVYAERALLCLGLAFERAGLLVPERLGGPSVNPLLAHSMGLRDVILALWSCRRVLCVTPEHLVEHPYRVIDQLKEYPPAHVTCGPGLLSALTQLMRQLPMMQQAARDSLRCVVSSGAQAQPELTRQLPWATLANAFGMTEAQQISTTLLGAGAPDTLGSPLPGASMGLGPGPDPARYRLYVKAPWMASQIDEAKAPTWLETQDLIERTPEGAWRWWGRLSDEVQSSGLGLKLALHHIERRYQALDEALRQLVLVCPPQSASLVGVIYVGQRPIDAALKGHVKATLDAAQERWARQQPAWAQGELLEVVALLPGQAPKRSVGKLDRAEVLKAVTPHLEALLDPYASHALKVELAPVDLGAHPMRAIHPRQLQLLQGAGLDWEYVDARGDELIAARGDERVPVLDLVGGYGVNLLGHKHEPIMRAAHEALQTGVPMLAQASARRWAGRLGQRLSDLVGQHTQRAYVTCLASTGAEAVELALKHALLARSSALLARHHALRVAYAHEAPELVRQAIAANEERLRRHRPTLLALRGGFHGKTAGALHALADQAQREPFEALLGLPTIFLPAQPDEDAWAQLDAIEQSCQLALLDLERGPDGELRLVERATSNLLAALVEPILGEGGVEVVPMAWLERLARGPMPLIVDEIQCGLGRSGSLLACQGLRPAYLILGKALGGGVAKIAATLIERERYEPRFDELSGSTFAQDDLSCQVALATLDEIERLQIPAQAARAGQALGQALQRLAQRHRQVITRVEGRGVMWGVRLRDPNTSPSIVLSALAARGLGYLASAYLLNVHQVRVMPTLSAPDVLRLEPSALISQAQIDRVERALDALCEALTQGNLFELLAHTSGSPADELEPKRQLAKHFSRREDAAAFRIERQAPPPLARRVAFIHNPVHTTKLLLADAPPLALLSASQRLEMIDRYTRLLELGPMPSFSRVLHQGRVWMMGITMAATPLMLDHLKRRGELELIHHQLHQALRLAQEAGCQIAVLGAQTSVVSASGASLLAPEGMTLTSGNALTAAITLRRVAQAAHEVGLALAPQADATQEPVRLAIVGALGSIGQALAESILFELGWRVELVLVGRPGSQARLDAMRQGLLARVASQGSRPLRVDAQATLQGLERCAVVVATVSGAQPILDAQHLRADGPLIVADLSEPHAVAAHALRGKPQARLVHAGFVRLPHDPDFMLSAHSPRGQAFACAAEGLLLGLSPAMPELKLTGPIDARAVRVMLELGQTHGLL